MTLNDTTLEAARAAVAAYVPFVGDDDEPLETQVSDLIADLLYLVRIDGEDLPESVADRAVRDYVMDLNELGLSDDPDDDTWDDEYASCDHINQRFCEACIAEDSKEARERQEEGEAMNETLPNVSVNTERIIAAARDLASETAGENGEYDRALVELSASLLGMLSDETRGAVHEAILGDQP